MTSPSTDRRYGLSSGLAIKAPCRAATTAAITLSGEQTVDGVALISGDRCLVKDQVNSIDNGVYVVDTGSWERDADFDGARDIVTGTLIKITEGTNNGGDIAEVMTTGTIIVGTTPLTFLMRVGTLAGISSFGGQLIQEPDAASALALLGGISGQWIATNLTPTRISNTSYSVVGNQTVDFHIGRHQKFAVTAGTVFGRITSSAFAAGITTVVLQMDGAQALDTGLSAVLNSILTSDVLSLPKRIATTTGLVNVYAAVVGIQRVVIGDEYEIKFALANNGALAPTLNLDLLGAQSLLLQSGAVPPAGSINGEHIVRATSAGFIVLNPNPVYPSVTSELYFYARDQKALATAGGTFTSGAYRTRDLNTVVNAASFATLAVNQVTLAAGTYKVRARAPAYEVDGNQARLQNITATATLGYSNSCRSPSTQDNSGSIAEVNARFTLAVSSVIELQHFGNTTENTNGFGFQANAGVGTTEVYSEIQIWKEF